MPIVYQKPEGDKKVEFWFVSSGGIDKHEIVNVPSEWSEYEITEEMNEWCEFYFSNVCASSELIMKYGWNHEEDFGGRGR